jgi:hypothetical protein
MTNGADGPEPGNPGGPGNADRDARDTAAGDEGPAAAAKGEGLGGERPGGRELGGAAGGEGSGDGELADGEGSGGAAGGEGSGDGEAVDDREDHGAYAHATPEQLLVEAQTARRRARRARHAYWFPLVLFGLLSLASVPFYIQRFPLRGGVYYFRQDGPSFLGRGYLGGFGPMTSGLSAYYWLAAILAGLAATAVWYRRRGAQVGLRTPSRGYIITSLVLLVLALLIPALAGPGGLGALRVLMPGDLLIRGTFPVVLIALGLCVLAWAERSVALSVIAAGYLALALVASLYDIENVLYDLGWNISPDNSGLPNVVLPALVLLLSGAGAWVVQRRRGPRSARPPEAGQAAVAGQPS